MNERESLLWYAHVVHRVTVRRTALFATATLVGLTACGGDDSTGPTTVAPTGLVVVPAATSVTLSFTGSVGAT